MAEIGCGSPTSASLSATVSDADTGVTSVVISYTIGGQDLIQPLTHQGGDLWTGPFGPFTANTVTPGGESVAIDFVATDGATDPGPNVANTGPALRIRVATC